MQPGRKIKKLSVYPAQVADDSDGITPMGKPSSISNKLTAFKSLIKGTTLVIKKEAPINARREGYDSSAATTAAPTLTRRSREIVLLFQLYHISGLWDEKLKTPTRRLPSYTPHLLLTVRFLRQRKVLLVNYTRKSRKLESRR